MSTASWFSLLSHDESTTMTQYNAPNNMRESNTVNSRVLQFSNLNKAKEGVATNKGMESSARPVVKEMPPRLSNESGCQISRGSSITDSTFASIPSNTEHFRDIVNGTRSHSGGVKTHEISFVRKTVTPKEVKRYRLLVSVSCLASHVPTDALYSLLEETNTDPVLRSQSRNYDTNEESSSSFDESDSAVSELSDLSAFDALQLGEISEPSASIGLSVRVASMYSPSMQSLKPRASCEEKSSSSSLPDLMMTPQSIARTLNQGASIDGDMLPTLTTPDQLDSAEQHCLDEIFHSCQKQKDLTQLIRNKCAKVVSRGTTRAIGKNYHLRRPSIASQSIVEDDMKLELALKALGVGIQDGEREMWEMRGNKQEHFLTLFHMILMMSGRKLRDTLGVKEDLLFSESPSLCQKVTCRRPKGAVGGPGNK